MKQLRQHHRGSRDGMFHGSRNEIMSLCSVEQMNPSPQWLFRMCRTYKVVFYEFHYLKRSDPSQMSTTEVRRVWNRLDERHWRSRTQWPTTGAVSTED